MKILMFLSMLYLSIFIHSRAVAANGIPSFKFVHDPYFDDFWCSPDKVMDVYKDLIRQNNGVPKAWKTELQTDVMSRLQNAWNQDGKLLLKRVTQIVGRDFVAKNMTLNFYLCPNVMGASTTLRLFPIWPYLENAIPDKNYRWTDRQFTHWYMLHEVLHHYAYEKIDYTKPTPLLIKYGTLLSLDPEFANDLEKIALVWDHLHINVIRKILFGPKNLNDPSVLKAILLVEHDLPTAHPSYKKAWDLVNSMNESELSAFIKELQ